MTDNFNPTEWLTTQEAAELTGYTPEYLRHLVRSRKVRAVKRLRTVFLDRDSLTAYVDEMRRLGPAKHDPWRTGARKRDSEAD
ncbi:MAG: helix-turn-helix domain-containing protein [Anaerolineales bacterium]|nr:helix-turn-helix domain-containing protein [Anaerolineales bacterium]